MTDRKLKLAGLMLGMGMGILIAMILFIFAIDFEEYPLWLFITLISFLLPLYIIPYSWIKSADKKDKRENNTA